MGNIYFWGVGRAYGFLSNWYPSPFKMNLIKMKTSEHAFIWSKAQLFDNSLCTAILNSKTPKEAKSLGRRITGFCDTTWIDMRERIMYQVNFLKFTQNPELLKQLYQTYPNELIEASPLDKIWGSGWEAKDHIKHESNHDVSYPGLNLLGKTLTRLRNDLMEGKVVSAYPY